MYALVKKTTVAAAQDLTITKLLTAIASDPADGTACQLHGTTLLQQTVPAAAEHLLSMEAVSVLTEAAAVFLLPELIQVETVPCTVC